MAININANMALGSAQYLDARQSVATLDALLALDTNIIPNGFECYVEALDCKYKYHEEYNESETGHWKLMSVGEVTASDIIVAHTPDEADELQKKVNRNKLMFYMGNTKSSYVHGELYYLHWNAITIKKFYTKGGGILEIDYDVLEQRYANWSDTITFNAKYKEDPSNAMNRWFCEYSGGSGSRLDVVGVNIANGSETLGDVIEFTYNSASKNSDNYTWKPLFVKPQRTFEKNWWLVNKIATYGGGYDNEFINGHRYQFTADININATASENIVVSLDEEQYKNYFGLHSKSSFIYNANTGCFEYRYGAIGYEDNRFTIEYLNKAGITWTGEIANDDAIIITCTMSDDINDYYWKDLEYAVEGDAGHIELTQAEYDALTEDEKMNGSVYFITDAEEEIQIDDSAYIPDMYDRNANGDIPVVPFDRLANYIAVRTNKVLVSTTETEATYDEDYVGGYVFNGANDILVKDKEMFNKIKVLVHIPGVLRIGIVNEKIYEANPRYSTCLVKWLVADFVAFTGMKEYDIDDTVLEEGQSIFLECRTGVSSWYLNTGEATQVGAVTYPANSCTTGLNSADKLDTTTNNALFKSQKVNSSSCLTSFGNNMYSIGGNIRSNFRERGYNSGALSSKETDENFEYFGGLNIGLYRRTKYSDTRFCKCVENCDNVSVVGNGTSYTKIYASLGQEALEGKSVYAFKLDVDTIGNITIYHMKGTTTDTAEIIDKYTHYVRAKGLQTIHLPFDIKLGKGEYIAFGGVHCKSTSDNVVQCECKWNYKYGNKVSWMNTYDTRQTNFYNITVDLKTYPEKITSISENTGYINVELICRGEKKSPLEDKYISFTGDSITTFAGFCTTKTGYPEGNPAGDNAVYYPASGKVINNVDATWWGILAKDNRMKILRNDAWSGSKVSSSEGSTDTRCLCGTQRRYYLRNGYNFATNSTYPFGRPEIIVSMIGTNDLSGNVELGSEMFRGVMGAEEEYKTILSAFSLFCRRIHDQEGNGGAKIVHFLIPRGSDYGYANANGVTIADLSLHFERIAKAWGQYFIPLSYFNGIKPNAPKRWSCPTGSMFKNTIAVEFPSADGLHPNAMGMEAIADGVHRFLCSIM